MLVVREDVDINSKNENGTTPLIWAATNGHEAVARLLLERGNFNTNSSGEYGMTPLQWAAINN